MLYKIDRKGGGRGGPKFVLQEIINKLIIPLPKVFPKLANKDLNYIIQFPCKHITFGGNDLPNKKQHLYIQQKISG